jgi:pyruvate,water dikinase
MKILFTKILEKTEEYIVTRENLKTVWVKSIFAQRLLYLAIADKLVDNYALRERDDIFYLKMTEVSDIIKGYQGPEDMYTVIPERKTEQAICENLEVPEVVIGKPPSPEELTCTVELKNLLEGMGCSPGVVRGRARVGSSPSECTELEEGEILVAPVTDPGWSPLFVTAGGLVMELGGTLSHGVIIAREYGIPAVVGVKNATKVIETGQIITVDGNKGVVYIE